MEDVQLNPTKLSQSPINLSYYRLIIYHINIYCYYWNLFNLKLANPMQILPPVLFKWHTAIFQFGRFNKANYSRDLLPSRITKR
jgi:hypothetical protein